MKRFDLRFLFVLLFSATLFSSCSDDSTKPEEKSQYIGNYTIKSAKITESPDLEIYLLNEEGQITDTMNIPFVGQDFTEMIQQALLGVVKNCSADASLIELREDNSMYLSCATSDFELYAGLWSEKDNGTTLVLSFNSDAIPSSPTGYTLEAYNVKLEGDIMYSTAGIPIPKEMIALAMEADGRALLSENNPDIINFVMELEFNKVD